MTPTLTVATPGVITTTHGTVTLAADGSFTYAPTANFNGPDNVAFGVDLHDPFHPQFPVLNGVNVFDPGAYALASWQAPADDPTSQRNVQGALSVGRS